jgi:4-coumarate--CoA ligase
VDKYDFSSVTRWLSGAAPLGNDLIETVEKRTKTPVRGGYGVTEATCIISAGTIHVTKRGSIGNLLPNVTAKLVDGELWVKGPGVMKGYLHNPKADAETFTTDGWLKTGDIVVFDEDEDMFIVDRVKEVSLWLYYILYQRGDWLGTDEIYTEQLIKYKGFQVNDLTDCRYIS